MTSGEKSVPATGALILLTGPPGAGKTTVARELAKRYDPSILIPGDTFWQFIAVGAVPAYEEKAHQQNTTVMTSLATAALAFAHDGYNTIVEGIIGPWFLQPFLDNACAALAMHYIVLRPDAATTVARARARTSTGALTDPSPIRHMYRQFLDLGDYERHTLDTSDDTAERTTNRIAALLDSGQFLVRSPSM